MTIVNIANASPQELSAVAEEINAMLASESSVKDCVTVVASERESLIRAYVVGTGMHPERQFRPKINNHIAQINRGIEVHLIAISNLPLTVEGRIDIRLLSELPVIDLETASACERRLQARYPGSQISVDIVERNFPTPLIHCTDLGIKAIQIVKVEEQAHEKHTPAPAVTGDSGGTSRQAIVHKAPLTNADAAKTLPEALLRVAGRSTDRGVGYIDENEQWSFQSYTMLYEDAQDILAALQNHGCSTGDKVLLQLSSNSDFIPAFWACIIGGIVPVPMAVPLTYNDVANIALRNVIDTWSFLGKPPILTSKTNDTHMTRVFLDLGLSEIRTLTIEMLRETSFRHDAITHPADPDDLAMLLLTSGSSGCPKGICYTHRNLVENVAASAAMNQVSDTDVSLNWLNLDHVGALVRCCIRDVYVGNTQIHAPAQLFLHDPLRWLDWIETYRVTFAWAPNFGLALLNRRLRARPHLSRDLSFVRSILSVAEPIVPRVAREFIDNLQSSGIGPEKLHAAWGMSETCAAVVFSYDFLSRLPSPDYPFVEVGSPVPGLSIRIVDDIDHILEEGVAGNVQITGAMVVSRYFADQQATEIAYTSDGWFRTGDLGFIRDGKLTITGRKKDTIIINGRNIASHEIESVVDTVTGVEKTFTAAIGVREGTKDTDQLVVLFHTGLKQEIEQRMLLDRIVERVVTEIGIRPAYVFAIDSKSIPKSSAGKILRSRLRDSFLKGNFDDHIKRSDLLLENERTLPGWFVKRSWRRKNTLTRGQLQVGSGITIIFQDTLGLARELQERLETLGRICLLVRPGDSFHEENNNDFVINPGNEDHYRLLIERISRDHHLVHNILHLWAYTSRTEQEISGALDGNLDLWFLSLAFLAKALYGQMEIEQTVTVHVCATDAQPVSEEDYVCCEKGLALGLVNTLPQEQPFLDWRHYDLENRDVQEAAELVMNELATINRDREVAYRRGMRLVPVLEEIPGSDFSSNGQTGLHIEPGGLYLITDGLGEIGLEIAQALIEDKDAKLLLVGRRPLPSQSSASLHAAENVVDSPTFTKALQRYTGLKLSSPCIEYRAVDVCDERALKDMVEDLEARWKTPLCGVFHLARVTDNRLIRDQTRDGLLNTLKPKVQGTLAVAKLLATRPDAFFVAFSSVSSTLGTYRMAAYASANRFIDHFCVKLRDSMGRKARSMAWSIWEEVGSERHYQMRDLSRKRGLFTLSTKKGIASMFAAMRCRETVVIIGLDPANRYIRQYMDGQPETVNMLRAHTAFKENETSRELVYNDVFQDRFGHTVDCQLVNAENDQSSLHDPAVRQASSSPELVRHRAELEAKVSSIWEKLLQIDCVVPEDNFFNLGGDSILAAQFVVELDTQTNEHIDMGTLFEHPMLGDLVDTLVFRKKGSSRRIEQQLPSIAELSSLLISHYDALSLAVRRQFPQVLEYFPVENYIESIRQLPALAGYSQIGVTCGQIMAALSEKSGDDLEPLYNRLAIVHAIQCAVKELDRHLYTESIERLFIEWFHDVLEDLGREDEYFRLGNDPFLKDVAVCTGRMIPIGGAWTIEKSGISRRMYFSCGPRQLLARTVFLLSRLRHFKPFYQIHMSQRYASRFNEEEREAGYLRIAEMLGANPGVRGLIGSSWYLDPALKTISPELSYLLELPESNGALIYPLSPSNGTEHGALAGSVRRMQLYNQGEYLPRNAFIIWPRNAMLKWANNR